MMPQSTKNVFQSKEINLPLLPQVPGVTSVLPVTMETPMRQAGSASHASATVTLTCWTRGHVTPARAPVSNACTTPRGRAAIAASWVTTATHSPKAAEVSHSYSIQLLMRTRGQIA